MHGATQSLLPGPQLQRVWMCGYLIHLRTTAPKKKTKETNKVTVARPIKDFRTPSWLNLVPAKSVQLAEGGGTIHATGAILTPEKILRKADTRSPRARTHQLGLGILWDCNATQNQAVKPNAHIITKKLVFARDSNFSIFIPYIGFHLKCIYWEGTADSQVKETEIQRKRAEAKFKAKKKRKKGCHKQ